MEAIQITLGKLLEYAEESKRTQDKIEAHLAQLNGSVAANCLEIALLQQKARDNRRMIMGIWTAIAGTVAGLVTVVFKHLGVA